MKRIKKEKRNINWLINWCDLVDVDVSVCGVCVVFVWIWDSMLYAGNTSDLKQFQLKRGFLFVENNNYGKRNFLIKLKKNSKKGQETK